MTQESETEGTQPSTGNPARDLLRIIEGWQAAGRSVPATTGRGLSGPGADDGAATVRSAMLALARIVHSLDYLDTFKEVETTTFRRQLNVWTLMIAVYPDGWTAANSNRTAFDDRATDNLRTLASFINVYTPSLDTSGREHIVDYVGKIRSLLEADADLPDELRGYIFRLITEIDTAVRESRLAMFDLEDALVRLKVALYGAAGATESEEARSKWSNLAEKFGWPVAAGMVSSAPQLALAVADIAGA